MRNQIYLEGLAQIMSRVFDFGTMQWEEKKQTIGEIRISIATLKEDLTNSQTQSVKVMTFNRISAAGIDAKKVKITYDEVAYSQ